MATQTKPQNDAANYGHPRYHAEQTLIESVTTVMNLNRLSRLSGNSCSIKYP